MSEYHSHLWDKLHVMCAVVAKTEETWDLHVLTVIAK